MWTKRISENEGVILGKNQLDIICQGSMIIKDSGWSEDVESRITKTQGVFFTVEMRLEEKEHNVRTKIRILEATTVAKHGSESWALQKTEEDLLDIFKRNCLRIV